MTTHLHLLPRLRMRGATPPNILSFYDVHTEGFGLTLTQTRDYVTYSGNTDCVVRVIKLFRMI
jgi:hypothetical protein